MAAGLLSLAAGTALDGRSAPPERPDASTIAHVLNRIGFGPRPGDVAHVQAIGLDAYIDQQLHPDRIDDSALDARLSSFSTLRMSTRELADQYFLPAQQLRRAEQLKNGQAAPANGARGRGAAPAAPDDPSMMAAPGASAPPQAPAPSPEVRQAQMAAQTVIQDLNESKMLRAATSERQLQEVLVDFWFNHFNVFVGKGQVRLYLTEYERDAIRPHVLGKFRDLLGAVAHSPAMLFYLDNWQSSGSNAAPAMNPAIQQRLNNPRLPAAQRDQMMKRLQQLQGQQARGLNENYGREIMELHTLGVDGGYTQQDVTELARILTGWTIDRPQQGGGFMFRPQMHDNGTKTFLGQTFHGSGESEGERALDILASHPNTAHHIAFELAQRFVADDPPAALVDRAAKTFLDTKGDLREVVRTIITAPEFYADAAYRAKVKTPLEFVVSAVRATGATVVNPQPMVAAMRNLGMPLYGCQPPTGYSMTADAWVNTGALLNRMNFAVQLVSQGGRVQPQVNARGEAPKGRAAQAGPLGAAAGRGRALLAARGPMQVDMASLAPDTSAATRDHLIDVLLSGRVSDATRQTLARAETPQNLVALALGSPEFQHR
jgi:uncharacterized protein (DUF1800 family)